MADFFQDLDPQLALELERLARVSYELREARAGLLRYHDVADEASLLGRILQAELPEHPTWEHYLAARIMEQARQAARAHIAGRDAKPVAHLSMKDLLETEYADRLADTVTLTQDALVVQLRDGIQLTLRWAAPDAYSFAWQNTDGSRQACIDTAPTHGGMLPHRHLPDGQVIADTTTRLDADAGANLRALMAVLAANPNFGLE